MDGQKITFNFKISSNEIKWQQVDGFRADLLITDKDYFQYHNSIKKYTDGSNPFAEFSPVYSNVQGGVGIFSSYVKFEKTVDLNKFGYFVQPGVYEY
jgi:hypothetical protein